MRPPSASSPPSPDRALFRNLIVVYIRACGIGVIGGVALLGLGLDLTSRQFLIGLGIMTPVSLVPILLADIAATRIYFRPIRAFLQAGTAGAARALAPTALV